MVANPIVGYSKGFLRLHRGVLWGDMTHSAVVGVPTTDDTGMATSRTCT